MRMALSLVSVWPLPPPMAVAVAVKSALACRADLGKPGLVSHAGTSVRGGLCCLLWRVTRLRRKAEEARRHKSRDHLCRHDRPARGGAALAPVWR